MSRGASAAGSGRRTDPGHRTQQNAGMAVKAHSHDLTPFTVLLMEWES